MKPIFLLLLITTSSVAFSQGRNAYKKPFEDAEEKFEKGQWAEALEGYKDALALNDKPDSYRIQGALFAYYMPRYKIALCYEKLDNIKEAAQFIIDSETARESNSIRNKSRLLAQYNQDVARIKEKLSDVLAQVASTYNNKLTTAQGLLQQNKFEEAEEAFKELQTIDPSRSEAAAQLAGIPIARNNYLASRAIDAQKAILDRDFGAAEGIIQQIAAVDAGFKDIPILRGRLKDEQAKVEAERVAANTPKEPPRGTPVTTPPRETPIRTAEDTKTTTPPKRDLAAERRAAAAKSKRQVRDALLSSIDAYRKGDVEGALDKINAVDENKAGEFASYHWLKGVYLVTLHQANEGEDPNLLARARSAHQEVAKRMPNFQPNADLFPDFVVDFYNQSKTN